jgi:hypothetical protein
LVERRSEKPEVDGSTPSLTTSGIANVCMGSLATHNSFDHPLNRPQDAHRTRFAGRAGITGNRVSGIGCDAVKSRPPLERAHIYVLIGWTIVLAAPIAMLIIGLILDRTFPAINELLLAGVILGLSFGVAILMLVGVLARFALASYRSRMVFLILAPLSIAAALIGSTWLWPWF